MTSRKKIHEGKHLNKYLMHTPWYLLSSLTTKAMGFLLIPLFTHYLSPQEYGTLSTVESIGRLLPIFIALYLDSAFNRFYFKEKEVSQERVSSLYSTHFWFILFWGGGVCIATIAISPLLFSDLPDVDTLPIVVMVITQLLNQLAVMVTMVWNANLLAKKLAIFQVAMSLVGVVLTWYLLVFESEGWESRLYALGIVSVVQVSILIYIAIKSSWIKLEFQLNVLKRSLKYSIPLLPNLAAGWIAVSSDRLIMAYYGQLDQVGLYSIAAQIAMLMYVFNDAITKVQNPIAMSGLTSDKVEAKKNMANFLIGYFTLMSIIYILLVLFSRELLYYFTEKSFHSAYQIVIIIGVIYFCSGIYRVFTNVISYHGAMWNISIAAIIQASINIGLNFVLIPIFGMYAAAFSTVVSMLAYTIWIFYRSQQLDKIVIDYKSILKIITLLCVFVSASLIIDTYLKVGGALLLIKLILFLIFISVLYSFKSSQGLRNLTVTLLNFIKRR